MPIPILYTPQGYQYVEYQNMVLRFFFKEAYYIKKIYLLKTIEIKKKRY